MTIAAWPGAGSKRTDAWLLITPLAPAATVTR
jgi:hypothetical protein